MAITMTKASGSAGVMTVDFELELYAGTLNDSTAWLDGGAAAGSYPGALAGFQAKNSNTTDAASGLKLIVGTCTLIVDDATFTVGNGASTVHAIVIGGSGVAATSLSVDAGLGTSTVTFAAEGTITGSTGFMAIVS